MDRGFNLVDIFLFISPIIVLGIKQSEIIQETVLDAGGHVGAAMIPYYVNVLDLTNRNHIRFAVKSGGAATLLFSERLATSIDHNTDFEYTQIGLGGWGNTASIIRVGNMHQDTTATGTGPISTPSILDNTMLKYFWGSWDNGMMKIGYGFEVGENMFMETAYPGTTDMKYLALWNGWGFGGTWEIYAGPEFECKPENSGELSLVHYYYMLSPAGMMESLGIVQGRGLGCSTVCYQTADCAGYTSYTSSLQGDVCGLYGYYPLPADNVTVYDYYQLNCP